MTRSVTGKRRRDATIGNNETDGGMCYNNRLVCGRVVVLNLILGVNACPVGVFLSDQC